MRQFALAAACAALAGLALEAHAAPPFAGTQITQTIDDRVRVSLPGNVRPEAHDARNDRGVLGGNVLLDHILLLLKRPPGREEALTHFVDQLYDPHSPNFHRWLDAPELRHEYGPAGIDTAQVAFWLRHHGLKVNAVTASGMVIDFSGTVRSVRQVFGTPIHILNVQGVRHIANIRDPEIPAALQPVVAGIVSLNDFQPHPMYRLRTKYAFKPGSDEALLPADIATIYNIAPLFKSRITGRGQTIALVENGDVYSAGDWTLFRTMFGLARYRHGALETVHPNTPTSHGNCAKPAPKVNDGEATLDAEWASAAAPSAKIAIASCRDTQTTFGGLIALLNLINEPNPPSVIDVGFGECEPHLGAAANAAYYVAYQQAAAEGISVFVASGNGGAAGCDTGQWVSHQGIAANGLASTPYNVAVGGTDFADTYDRRYSIYWNSVKSRTLGTALTYVPEIPWNDSCASALGAAATTQGTVAGAFGPICNTNGGSVFWGIVAGGGGPSGCAHGAADPVGVAAVSGTCAGYPKPSWQSGVTGIPGSAERDLPDVSLFAGDGVWLHHYVLCWSDAGNGGIPCSMFRRSWSGGGGTSFSAAVMAGLQALIDQKKRGRQGNPNPVFYALAAKPAASSGPCNASLGREISPACIFHDVSAGDNAVNCTSAQNLGPKPQQDGGPVNCFIDAGFMGKLSLSNSQDTAAYEAGTGWDFATGLGSVNAANLVNAWP